MRMSNSYVVGAIATRTITFLDTGGSAINPTTVSASVTAPSGTISSYTYPASALTRLTTGLYQLQFAMTETGTWLVHWVSTGTGTTAAEEYLWATLANLANPTLTGLIGRLRGMVNDQAGTAQVFTDVQLQDRLEDNRLPANDYPIFFEPITRPGTTYLYTRGRIEAPGWYAAGTAGGTVRDSLGSVITGWTLADDGRITFSADQAGSLRYFSGYTYDLYASAARTLEDWASRTTLDFDFITDQQQFNRNQKYKALIAQADRFWSLSLPQTVQLNRDDTLPMGRNTSMSLPRNGGRFTSPYWSE